jgi:hypothetical protein
MYMNVHAYLDVHIYTYRYMYICIHIDIHTHIHIYIYIDIYIYIYIQMCIGVNMGSFRCLGKNPLLIQVRGANTLIPLQGRFIVK